MSKSLLFTGIFFLVFNMMIYLLLTSFKQNQFLISELSILLTFALLYFISRSKIDDGYKIFLTFSFVFSGIAKYVLSFFFELPFIDNGVFITIVIISASELLSLIGITYFNRHS